MLYPQIGATVSNQFELPDFEKSSTPSHQFETKPEVLVSNLSFSHIREIMVIEDDFERFFYETECMKCNWSVRELRRQIKTNLFVRAGISKNPELLLTKSVDNASSNALTIKDPFTFEFLGLDAKEAVSESDLEQALMDHLQEFMLELGQLNAYVGYYKKNEMMPGDNPPVGILLCTDKGSQMVEYALSGMDNQLFVSTYMLHLPDKRKLEEFMLKELEEMGM